MPPKKRSKPQNDNMPEMIGTKLSDVQLAEYDEWLTKNSKQFSKLYAGALLDSIKIGVSWDAYNNCFICSFTQKDEDNVNHGKCLLSRSMEWEDAVLLNVYKSEVVYQRGEWIPLNNNDQRG